MQTLHFNVLFVLDIFYVINQKKFYPSLLEGYNILTKKEFFYSSDTSDKN